jgi:hypothetical protein
MTVAPLSDCRAACDLRHTPAALARIKKFDLTRREPSMKPVSQGSKGLGDIAAGNGEMRSRRSRHAAHPITALHRTLVERARTGQDGDPSIALERAVTAWRSALLDHRSRPPEAD